MLTDQLTSAALGGLLQAADAAPGLHVPRRRRLYSYPSEPADQVRAGIALERVLLTATARDVRAECVNHTLIRFGERTGTDEK